MNVKQIRQALLQAFNCKTSKELKKHLTKTDLRSKAEMLHAASVVWSYGIFYPGCVDRDKVRGILEAQSIESQYKLAYEAKNGFGTYVECPTDRFLSYKVGNALTIVRQES